MSISMKKAREIGVREECPCDSGKRYGQCCKKKRFRWVRDGRGRIAKEIPLHPEALKVLEQEELRFREIFRRRPVGDDRVWMTAWPQTLEDYREIEEELFAHANVPPEVRYAARKTGRILTEEAKDLLSDPELDEWYEAVEEYFDFGADSESETAVGVAFRELLDEFGRLPFLFAIVIEKSGTRWRLIRDDTARQFAHSYIFFCATRTLKTLRAISNLLDSNLGEDALALVRSIYENYLNIIYTIKRPTAVLDFFVAVTGTNIGTHEYVTTSKGKVDRRHIIEKETGRITPAHVTTAEMARQSPFQEDLEIHQYLYSFLSRYTHPHPFSLEHYVDEQGFTATRREMLVEALLFTMVVAALVLDALLQISLRGQSRADIRRFLRHVHRRLTKLFDQMAANETLVLVQRRLVHLLRPWPGAT